ncbi:MULTISPECIES: class I SAM-dependent methyltransferase [unclassified Streptomyces]|uniref:class I SAM-dependent methyltransferase n=1 Tax=unclassified Streptomyces TaxID=2593676 RepID=UPI00225233BD|nr:MULTISPECIES: class I SAM-dependent methyltransferase [unclassified Streptomyces]MCX4524442.1 class I SAM-dependent methyltransferase [Streptomyces sp. NBC_01551]MCX4545036.1 class I SAM-dependent methyltransferase [Streptomyces sp. NBC_01565]
MSTTPTAFSAADSFTLRTALDALGGVRGLDALDLACGHGGIVRLLASEGARRTVGVDSCPDRIRRARAAHTAEHTGAHPGEASAVEYVVADAAGMPQLGPFDLATAVYLFNHAPDRSVLHAMFRSIRANLRPGGRLLAIVPNAGAFPQVDWSPYGVRILDRVADGDAPLLKAQFLTEPPRHFEYREWSHSDFAEAAVEAGFATVGWQPGRPPPADAARDEEYWTAYRAWPVSSLMTCTA